MQNSMENKSLGSCVFFEFFSEFKMASKMAKQVVHQTRGDNFVNSQSIFTILSLLEREVNLQQNPCNISNHIFSVLPHYLAKFRSSSFHMQTKM